MAKESKYEQLARRNSELELQIEALRNENDLLKCSFQHNDNYYKDKIYKINENVKDVVYRFNLKSRKYEYISPSVKELFGHSQQEFYNTPSLFLTLVHSDSRKEYIQQWRNIVAGKVPEYLEIKIRLSEEVRWILQKNLVVKDDSGAISCVEGVVTDITEKKLTENALIDSEAQKRAILNNLPHLAWLKDCDGVYLSVNNAFSYHINKSFSEIIGKTDFELYDYTRARRYRDEDLLVILNKKQLYIEERSADYFWETFKAPIFNDKNEIIGVTGIALEISTRKRSEEEIKEYSEKLSEQNDKLKLFNDELTISKEKAEEADRLKTAFLANMSHEIRTPMNAILGFATLLRDRKLPEQKQIDFINLINTNCRQLLHIISDIIDISKIEANQITIFNKNFNINKNIALLVQNFENQIKTENKPINIITKFGINDSNAQLFADKVRLDQILSNLLSNAIKFTEKGEIEIGYQLNKNKSEITFYVSDTGIGVSAKEQKVIFERFRQVSFSYNKQYGGTGLGLSISKGLANKMGGNIWVASKIEKGSTFYLSIPYEKGSKLKSEKIPYDTVYKWNKKTILIAEDEETNYSLLENIIKPTGAKIVWAKDGVEAVEACQKVKNIDLILMDLKMPRMNGIEATKQIKKQKGSPPIIAQTAFALPNDEENCLRAGCEDYLAKPLKVDDLLRKISLYINLRIRHDGSAKIVTRKS